eukprot:COSAG04_NODE_3034_length_3251_cov_224.076777_8_plen_131_part_01
MPCRAVPSFFYNKKAKQHPGHSRLVLREDSFCRGLWGFICVWVGAQHSGAGYQADQAILPSLTTAAQSTPNTTAVSGMGKCIDTSKGSLHSFVRRGCRQGVQSLHQHLVAVWMDCDTVRDSDRLRNLHTQH